MKKILKSMYPPDVHGSAFLVADFPGRGSILIINIPGEEGTLFSQSIAENTTRSLTGLNSVLIIVWKIQGHFPQVNSYLKPFWRCLSFHQQGATTPSCTDSMQPALLTQLIKAEWRTFHTSQHHQSNSRISIL